MENIKVELKLYSRYEVSEDGCSLRRQFTGTGGTTESTAHNILLADPDWDDKQLFQYIKDCVLETRKDANVIFEDIIFDAEMMAMVMRYTALKEPESKHTKRFWKLFLEHFEQIVINKDKTVFDHENVKLWDPTHSFPKASGYLNEETPQEMLGEITVFFMVQLLLMANLEGCEPEEEMEGFTIVLVPEKWLELKQVANACVDMLSMWAGLNAMQERRDDLIFKKCRQFLKIWSPEKIYSYLNEYISGQELAKMEFSHVCYEHVARIANLDLRIRKSNYVMYGPTGCGKTELARVIKKILPVPIEIVDASAITSNGFKGLDKEDVMFALEQNNPDISYGIVIMDEFDKLCVPSYDSMGSNINKLIQGELLKMVEGTCLRKDGWTLNTENITFICAGAFEGAFKSEIKNGFGFGSRAVDLNTGKTVMQCLEDFGMIPEMAGRICSVIPLQKLDEEDLYKILTQKKDNCIDNIRKLYEVAYSSKVRFSDAAMHEICRVAVENGLGARGLGGLVESVCHINRQKHTKDRMLRINVDMVRKSCAGISHRPEH